MRKFAGRIHLVGDPLTEDTVPVTDHPYGPDRAIHILGEAQITNRWHSSQGRDMISFRVFFDDGAQAVGRGDANRSYHRVFLSHAL